MIVNGEKFATQEAYKSFITVPDSWVSRPNKIGKGNGEAKLYSSSKDEMYGFYGAEGFSAKCFILKSDLLAYMEAIRDEYLSPSQNYRAKAMFPTLWEQRLKMVSELNDVVFFDIKDQPQIGGDRGYVKSSQKGFSIIREIALPLVSYIYVEKVLSGGKSVLYYWKLFVDFDLISERKNGPMVLSYGKGKRDQAEAQKGKRESEKKKQIRYAREGQGKYREQLLLQCHFCPVTMVADERILIASHIKPWAASTDEEKVDPYNGYMLSPLYDKLFDRGFITFTYDRHMILSDFLSTYTWKRLGITGDKLVPALPMDDKRVEYLHFHHRKVFKGASPS